jgi:hypothetical protein
MKPTTKVLLIGAMHSAEVTEQLLREAARIDADAAPDLVRVLDLLSEAFSMAAAVLDDTFARDEAVN